jgi:hypothetical protein
MSESQTKGPASLHIYWTLVQPVPELICLKAHGMTIVSLQPL